MARNAFTSVLSNTVAPKLKNVSTEVAQEPISYETGKNFLDILVDPPVANIDIVAIHGLNPFDNQSHATATWTANGKLWLRDFLPKRVPRARICLYGYNSSVALGSSAAGIREHGENMLNHLEQARTNSPRRPIIFLCHSLGGLVVKRALVHAKSDATYKQIWESTFGLVFFATPQQGGNHAGFGELLASIARSMLRNPSNTFMAALKGNSQVLSAITDDFRQMLEDFQIISFYETRPLGAFGIVVDPKSALLGLPGTRERQIAVDADHRNICKFARDDDPTYKLVEGNIAQMVNEATSQALSRRWNGDVCSDRRNTVRVIGEHNYVTQAGHTNESVTNGTANKTDQLGHRNKCEVEGISNTITQSSLSLGIFLLGFKFILDIIWASGNSQTAAREIA
ncbi:hypothetical protein F4777DRAFT_540755 [Nemania sp. FL0916]|nr:hypothetical protein F4777DRAFT_540755 [Nemania sp. FL0916]